MTRELQTVAALSSGLVEMNKSLAFQNEYAAASSQTEAEAMAAKYRYLFATGRHADTIALDFTGAGALSITHDGSALRDA